MASRVDLGECRCTRQTAYVRADYTLASALLSEETSIRDLPENSSEDLKHSIRAANLRKEAEDGRGSDENARHGEDTVDVGKQSISSTVTSPIKSQILSVECATGPDAMATVITNRVGVEKKMEQDALTVAYKPRGDSVGSPSCVWDIDHISLPDPAASPEVVGVDLQDNTWLESGKAEGMGGVQRPVNRSDLPSVRHTMGVLRSPSTPPYRRYIVGLTEEGYRGRSSLAGGARSDTGLRLGTLRPLATGTSTIVSDARRNGLQLAEWTSVMHPTSHPPPEYMFSPTCEVDGEKGWHIDSGSAGEKDVSALKEEWRPLRQPIGAWPSWRSDGEGGGGDPIDEEDWRHEGARRGGGVVPSRSVGTFSSLSRLGRMHGGNRPVEAMLGLGFGLVFRQTLSAGTGLTIPFIRTHLLCKQKMHRFHSGETFC